MPWLAWPGGFFLAKLLFCGKVIIACPKSHVRLAHGAIKPVPLQRFQSDSMHCSNNAFHPKDNSSQLSLRKLKRPAAIRRLVLRCASPFLLALCIAALSVHTTFAGESPSKSRIIVGGDHDYPPYEYLDENGQPAGYNVELTKAIARKIGVDVHIRLGPWANIRKGLETGEIDLIHGMFYSSERDKAFDFSPPHTVVHHVAVIRRNGAPPQDAKDLKGKRIVVMRGDIMHDFAVERGLGERLTAVETEEVALRQLADGQHDCALVARLPALYWIEKRGWSDLHVAEAPMVSPEYCYAALPENRTLLAQFAEGLATLEKTGEYRKIQENWLGIYSEREVLFWDVARYVLLALVPVLLLLAAALLWSRSLQQEVAARTEEIRREKDLSNRIVHDGPVAITQVNTEGRIVEANQRAIELLGITEANLYSRSYNAPEWQITDLQGNPFPDDELPFRRILETGEPVHGVEHAIHLPDGTRRVLRINGAPLHDAQDKIERIVFAIEDITLRQEHEANLATIAWMLDKESGTPPESRVPTYGDVTELNTDRTIRDSVGLATLDAMGADLMQLLDTSVAVYEKNGDYAYGSFVSEWCSVMDGASRRLCQADDNKEALACGHWLCHENCWNDSAKAAIESGQPTDIECVGGIHLYGVPIVAGNEVVGAINIGYGNPPTEDETLAKLAAEFGEDVSTLRRAALAFRPRPHCVVEAAKARLQLVAQQIGQMVENHRIQEELRQSQATLQIAMDTSPAGIAIADAPSGKLRYVNDAGLLIRGGSREEVVNGVGVDQYVASWQLLDLDGTPLPTDEVPLARAITRGESSSREFIIRRDENDDRIVIARAAPIKSEAGDVVAAIVVFLDITERKEAEKALIESEQRLSLATRAAGIGIWVWDIIQDTMVWDDRILELYGIKDKAPVIDLDFWRNCLHPEDREYAVDECMAAVRGERDYDIEFRVQWPDGTVRWMKADGLVIRNDAGEPTQMLGTNYDVTARKQAEEDLRLTVEAVSDGIWKWHFKTGNLEFSPKYYTMLGYEPNEFPATFESWRELIHPDDLAEALAVAEQYLATKPATYENTFRLRTKEGGYRWIRATARAVERDESGQAVRMIGNHEDISRQKDSAEQIRQLERRNRALLDYSPVCHKIVDLDFNLQYMNANGFKMLRLEQSEDLYGKPYPFDFFPEASRKQMSAELQRVKDTGEPVSFEDTACDVEGNEVWLHHTLIPVPDEDGGIEYITVVSADVTEQKRMQYRLRQMEKMDAIGQLAGGVAHDFNNQLAGVMGYADMLRSRLEEPDLQRFAENILSGARRAGDLTNKLLAFARKGQYESVPVDMHMVILEVAGILNHSIDKKIEVKQILGANPSSTRGDPTQLQNALLNLAINARDAMPEGGELIFETSVVQLDKEYCATLPYEIEPGAFLRVSVTDSGCGIPKEEIERIFEPFFTTKEVGRGTGMGLAAVYGTVKQHGGAINVYSEAGHGTTFKLYLPVEEQAAQRIKRTTDFIPAPRPASILVVDDEELIRNLAEDMLTSLGYSVKTKKHGESGVAYYEKHWREIDLVILDMVMPRMNGTEAYRAMKAINPDVKVLLASGYSINGAAQGLLAEGVQGFIQKPFERTELSAKVAEVLPDASE